MSTFLHKKLPSYSTLISGRFPRDEYGFPSQRLQIWYNDTEKAWKDPSPHYHTDSDEIFIVLKGCISVEVEGERVDVQAGEYICFPAGCLHNVIAVKTPIQSLMLRAPSANDKVQLSHINSKA
jgi:mannose-6-phosphate isomerase-like protein (cupin superfamily)